MLAFIQSRRRRARTFSLLTAAAAACGGGDAPDPLSPQGLAGTYTLRTVAGAPLPFDRIPGLSQLVGEEIRLGTDGTYRRRTSLVDTQSGRRGESEESGSWYVYDGTVRLRVPGPQMAIVYAATERGTLTWQVPGGDAWVYRR